MARLEDLTRGAVVKGILPGGTVTIVDAKWHGSSVLEVTYKDTAGRLGNELLYRDREPTLEVVQSGKVLSFSADAALFRLVSEAHRIRLAYLFDPLLAVHTSLVEPLPHQITAVYEAMIPRQPLRFLLADDPGSGKTCMAGLLIKELRARGDLQRCLIVCPGALVEQWQDEMGQKFHLPFEILTNDKLESARTGNWFQENPLAICRLDKLSRNEDLQVKMKAVDWDLVVVDEAHKMSASYFGGELKYTLRYRLGQVLSEATRHFLLLTATPHNGKEEDFQLFLALLDGDRFEGKYRDGVHTSDASDLMRRMVKEDLLKFDGTPLFPERRANTVQYALSEPEAALYKEVTDYVREQFNRADNLDEKRKGTVGFALTILQRRLASSPEAIYQSLRRRRERLEVRLREEKLLQRGAEMKLSATIKMTDLDEGDLEDMEDAPGEEVEKAEEEVVDQATAARTIGELEAEIGILQQLEALAMKVRASGKDKKWDELSRLVQDRPEMFDAAGNRRKLVIFTEHRDTLNYLARKIRGLLGREEPVVIIHGGIGREDRQKAQSAFTQDPEVLFLVATDAAGEGINLQRAHLMVNYDLPWNPNRLEQRFGRIHRIGQPEVCHLWNLVAEETREGDVYQRLLQKLEVEKEALGGRVFDVLGKALSGSELRDLLIQAIRYGEDPEVKARLHQVVDKAMDREHLKELLEERAIAADTMDATRVQKIREEMERAAARRLQPHFIADFFLEAFTLLGGKFKEREPKRYELMHVPGAIRERDRAIGTRETVLHRYERITFEKDLIAPTGKPLAEFVCPGHPLLDATLDIILEKFRALLKQGTVLVDPLDYGDQVRVLFYLEDSIQDARQDLSGNRRVISREVQFVEITEDGSIHNAGYAPYLAYRPMTDDEKATVEAVLARPFLGTDLEGKAVSYAITDLVPRHLAELKERREVLISKTVTAVRDRLQKEINYWDHRAEDLKAQEQAGKKPRLNSAKARERAEELASRLEKRLAELEEERRISPVPPVALGGALVVPLGLLAKIQGKEPAEVERVAKETKRVEMLAMAAVMDAEKMLGFEPRDVSADKCGFDIESRVLGTGKLRFLEVKGRVQGAKTVTVTKNEILTALNKPEDLILAIVEIDGEAAREPRYIRKPFEREPDFAVSTVDYKIEELLQGAGSPS